MLRIMEIGIDTSRQKSCFHDTASVAVLSARFRLILSFTNDTRLRFPLVYVRYDRTNERGIYEVPSAGTEEQAPRLKR